jgi:hypothetical protein
VSTEDVRVVSNFVGSEPPLATELKILILGRLPMGPRSEITFVVRAPFTQIAFGETSTAIDERVTTFVVFLNFTEEALNVFIAESALTRPAPESKALIGADNSPSYEIWKEP